MSIKSHEQSYLHPHHSAIELVDCELCGKEFEAEGAIEYGLFETDETMCDECKFKRNLVEGGEDDV